MSLGRVNTGREEEEEKKDDPSDKNRGTRFLFRRFYLRQTFSASSPPFLNERGPTSAVSRTAAGLSPP